VTAQDQFNNTTTTYLGTVHFTASDTQAVMPSDSTLTSGTGGFSPTLKTAGTRLISAADTATSSIPKVTGIDVIAANASSFSVTAQSSGQQNTYFSFTVKARDAYNNVASGYTGTVTFSSSDMAAVFPAISALASGVGTFSVKLKTAGTQTVTVTD